LTTLSENLFVKKSILLDIRGKNGWSSQFSPITSLVL